MDIEALSESPVGQLVPIQGEDARHGRFAYFAFLPDDLPDDLILTSSTWTAVAEATAAISRLQQACAQLPDPRLLIRPALWRESLDTSALEGTVGALRELLEAQLPSTQFLSPETVEIRAFEQMALHAFEIIRQRPISVSLLAELQAELFRGVQDAPQDIGRVRQHTVWIGEKDRPIEESRFVPPPPDDRLRAGLDAWEDWVQADHSHLPPVLRTALAHYQLETLHPFGDGNGRIGRLVVILQILKSGALELPALTLSPWLFLRRSEYQRELLSMSISGDWNPWVALFCRAVCEQSERLIGNAQKLVNWLRELQRQLHERRWSGVIHKVLEDLVEWPVTTITDTASKYGISQVHATRTINHLAELGILSEMTGGSYARIYGATYVMDTAESLRGD